MFDVDVSVGHESVQPRLREPAPPASAPAAAPTESAGHDPLARAEALVAELSAELARLRGSAGH